MSKKNLKKLLLSLCLVVLSVTNLKAQPDTFNHPELHWYSIETEHFFVHFDKQAERTARVVAKIAEDVYQPITSLYLYKPKSKIHFIIRDHDDYSNGGAFFYDNKVEIWAPAAKFDLRGTHNWLRNVVTHEFTHMVQMQSSRKITQRIPALYFQAIGYEDERRQDVLRGGPNVVASYPIAMTVMPGWFAEGVAQYQLPGLGYDTWDTHRDMILRTATLDNKLLTYNEMGVFGKNSLGNEKVYNQGYAFVSYLADTYGLETLRQVSQNMHGFFRLSLDGALKNATGKSGKQLYAEWISTLKSKYAYQTRDILIHKVEGSLIESKGMANYHAIWSTDGSKIAYITNKGNDYLSQTRLVVKDLHTGKTKVISGGVHYSISWSPDGKQIAYANKSARSKGGSHYYDLYTYDLSRKKERRLTKARRAHSPNWSHDGQRLAFVAGQDGTENLYTINLDDKKIKPLTSFSAGEQLYNPQWSPNDRLLLFAKSTGNDQDLYLMDVSNGKMSPIMDDPADSRDAVFSQDGKAIYFSWDNSGIFNIYSKNLYTKETVQWTNVLGGAFMPSISRNGDLLFSLFTSDGYKISMLKNPVPVDESKSKYLSYKNDIQLASVENSIPNLNLEEIKAKNYDDSKTPNYQVKPYKNHYSPIAVLPRVMIDYGTLKLGSYFYSNDILDKYGFLAGFDVNKRGDYDLFALIEYRNLGPTLFVEAYNQVQKTGVPVDSSELIIRGLTEKTSDRFKYNLVEVDGGVRFKLSEANELRTAFVFSRYSARVKSKEFGDVISFGFNYFIGRDISLRFTHRNIKPAVHSEISPKGRSVTIRYDRKFDKFLTGFEVDNRFIDGIGEVFQPYNYNKFTLNWQENLGMPIKKHTLSMDFKAGFIDTKVDSFFNFFAGGFWGNRGYSYFSIEGRKMLLGRFTYRFPIADHLDMRFMQFYFDKVFLGFYYDYGNAFNESIKLSDFKSTIGLQLRLESYSFYSYPTRVSLDLAYGLDEFTNQNQTFGKELRFYFGLSFGFLN
ncbi:MAG: DPP IV N-terminal domain-containing protein [bacterium]